MNRPALQLGQRIAPPRFILFVLLLAIGTPVAWQLFGARAGILAGFDLAASAFILSCLPLMRHSAKAMRISAARNDANRPLLLLITGIVMLTILAAVANELMEKQAPSTALLVLVVVSLALAWLFTNLIYTLHYAHLYYLAEDGRDAGGLDFPGTREPDYRDMLYFAFCLGMTFQTADVSMTSTRMRMVATAHCLAAFVFNLGIIAFTINVLGG